MILHRAIFKLSILGDTILNLDLTDQRKIKISLQINGARNDVHPSPGRNILRPSKKEYRR